MKAIKITLDVMMTILFLLLMKISFVGIALHELIGIGLFFLFAIHKLLNYRWIAGICKGIVSGKASGKARFMFGLDIVILLFVTFNVISGILISQTVLTSIEASDIALWSDLHHFTAYSSLVLLSVHIGLHWQMLMHAFGKLFGLTEANPARTILARITLVAVAFLGIKAITNPEVYGNFTAPFTPTAVPVSAPVEAAVVTLKKEPEQSMSTPAIALLSTDSLVVDVPSLEEYLSKLVCTGCGKRCPLTALRCGRGARYKNEAIAEYEATYMQSSVQTPEETTPAESVPPTASEKSPSAPIQDNTPNQSDISSASREAKPPVETIPSTSAQDNPQMPNDAAMETPEHNLTEETPSAAAPKMELPSEALPDNDGHSTSLLDYIGLMGIVIAGTHYTITIPKKRSASKAGRQM